VKSVSVQQALQYVADHPDLASDELIQVPVWELVSRVLYDIANNPDSSVRGQNARANKARKIILDRHVGKRAPGTAPAARTAESLEMVDLTKGALDASAEAG
jgi:hypothetical protein